MKTILAQTKPVYEYIIVDGGSKDGTMKIIESYVSKFQKEGIRFFYRSEKDKGISDAFNKGIYQATGDYIGLINAGDELDLKEVEILEKNVEQTSADVYYGDCIWVEPDKNLAFVSKPKEQNPSHLNRLLYEMVVIHPSTFIKKTAYEKCGAFDITFKYCMDQELLYRMVKKNMKFIYINEVLTRFMAGGVSDQNAKRVFDEASRIALANGEPNVKVQLIEAKKLTRNFLAKTAKKIGIYRILKKNI